jgi:hypothetical protein
MIQSVHMSGTRKRRVTRARTRVLISRDPMHQYVTHNHYYPTNGKPSAIKSPTISGSSITTNFGFWCEPGITVLRS